MASAGYSGTPLAQKLGLKDGQRVLFIELPPDLKELRNARKYLQVVDAAWGGMEGSDTGFDVIYGFTTSRAVREGAVQFLMQAIARDGAIWISWPKKASKVPTDITENTLREVALPLGLVDIEVCGVDAVWSGLKLVIRKQLRHRPA